MGSPCATHFLLGLMHLSQRPGLHGFLAHAPKFLYQAFFGVVGSPEIPCFGINNRQQGHYALSNLRMRVQLLDDFLVANRSI